jgi:hypothetical protein
MFEFLLAMLCYFDPSVELQNGHGIIKKPTGVEVGNPANDSGN